jgi:hypothetical protein
VIDKALVKFGRVARVRVTVEDSIGQLARLSKILSDLRCNLQEVAFDRAFVADSTVGYTQYIFTVEVCACVLVFSFSNVVGSVVFFVCVCVCVCVCSLLFPVLVSSASVRVRVWRVMGPSDSGP